MGKKLLVMSLLVAAGSRVAFGQGFDLNKAYEAELRADAANRTSMLYAAESGYDGRGFVLTDGGNNATVTISPNFNSNTMTLSGNLVPLEQSNIFKGRSW